MEELIVRELQRNLETSPHLRVKIIMDAYRGKRLSRPGSKQLNSYDMVNELKVENINRDIEIGLWRNNPETFLSGPLRLTELNEVLGVHHIKLAIFDNSVVLTGYTLLTSANLEEQYFLNRQDRYWLLNDAEKMCNYLEDVVASLLSSSDRATNKDTNEVPYGYDQLGWKNRSIGIKTQDRMSSYLASKLVDKKNSNGEVGVIETRQYNVSQIEDKTEKETSLQITGRESIKEK